MNIRKDTPVKEKFVLETEKSYRSILSDTYKLLIVNTRTLFMSVMPLCFVFGACVALAQLCMRFFSLPIVEMTSILLLTAIASMLLAMMIHATHQVLKTYAETEEMTKYGIIKQFKPLLQQSIPTWLMLFGMSLITEMLFYLTKMFSVKYSFVWVIGILLIMFLQMPFTLSVYKQAIGKVSILNAIKWGIKRLFKYFGSTLFLCFVAWISIGLMGFVCCLPIEILSISIRLSDVAVLLGDPTDLPSYMLLVYYVFVFLLMSIFFYFMLIWVISQIMQQISCKIKEQKSFQ